MKKTFTPTISFLFHKTRSYGHQFFISLFLLTLTLFINSCRKYPEDERFSSQTVKTRLTEHDWYYNAFFVNDHDSTISHLNKFTTAYSTDTRSIHFRIEAFKLNTDASKLKFYTPQSPNDNLFYPFSFRDSKKNIFLQANIPFGSIPIFFIEFDNEWRIRKLTKNDFIIEKEYNGIKYRLEFKN